MLICPQCNFENPNSNKFCQNCGASLTEKECQQCGVFLPLNAIQCHSCDTVCAEIGWRSPSKKVRKLSE
ncbi:MAG: zinc-ribbon domain-containing protein [Richelia sp. SM2_1_7]|nr:zinc-ribbon domain-containing protein [Richelia sp. SM2_1_7]